MVVAQKKASHQYHRTAAIANESLRMLYTRHCTFITNQIGKLYISTHPRQWFNPPPSVQAGPFVVTSLMLLVDESPGAHADLSASIFPVLVGWVVPS